MSIIYATICEMTVSAELYLRDAINRREGFNTVDDILKFVNQQIQAGYDLGREHGKGEK